MIKWEELPKWAIPTACSAVSFAAGAAMGYLLTKRQYDTIEEEIENMQLEFDFDSTELEREINKATYTLRQMRQETDKIIDATRDLAIVKDLPVESSRARHPSNNLADPRNIVIEREQEDDRPEEPDIEAPEGVVHIFAQTNNDPDWDYETECAHRSPDRPYVLHVDEFFADEMGIQENDHHETLTYYKGDQVLCTQNDIPIYDIEGTIGPLKFGHGSGDPSIFYVRNEAAKAEYEVVEDDGYYQETVLGEKIQHEAESRDVKHSRRPGKFRED